MFGVDNTTTPFPDITRMSITPTTPQPRTSNSNHTRSHSESFLNFPDYNLLITDPEIHLFDSTSPSPELNFNTNPYARQRSLSVDDDFFDDLGISYQGLMEGEENEKLFDDGGGVRAHRRRHSFDVDGSVGLGGLFDVEYGMDGVKKAMDPEKLAHLALVDPKKAKRILANRLSAARSKERKIRYTGELERKVQTLQIEATTLSAQVTLLQKDTTGLTSENKELSIRLQAMEQQAHLKEALNETLKNEVYRLRMENGQIPASNGHTFTNRLPQYYSQTSSHIYGGQKAHSQTQQLRSNSNSNNQIPNQSVQSCFMDYSN